jgi:hypothetical protein
MTERILIAEGVKLVPGMLYAQYGWLTQMRKMEPSREEFKKTRCNPW